jgi:8-oxo-dGTP pyrophosphatase MutT (NUDIX family)
MAEFAWHEGPVPAGMPVRQVHGWLADATGRVLVQDRVHEQRFLLAGGQCEAGDLDWSATLLRESREESQVRVVGDSIAYLGHQVVTGDSRRPGPYVQVRLFGVIEAFGPPAPDPDSGHVYRRLMTSIPRAAELLAWGRAGEQQSRAALRAARRLGLPVDEPAAEGYA